MGVPGQSSEVHTISPEIQVLQREGPVRPDLAHPGHNQPLPLEHCAPALGDSWATMSPMRSSDVTSGSHAVVPPLKSSLSGLWDAPGTVLPPCHVISSGDIFL